MKIKEIILSTTLLMAASSQAFASFIPNGQPLPEPETFALLGIGIVAMFLCRLKRK